MELLIEDILWKVKRRKRESREIKSEWKLFCIKYITDQVKYYKIISIWVEKRRWILLIFYRAKKIRPNSNVLP